MTTFKNTITETNSCYYYDMVGCNAFFVYYKKMNSLVCFEKSEFKLTVKYKTTISLDKSDFEKICSTVWITQINETMSN